MRINEARQYEGLRQVDNEGGGIVDITLDDIRDPAILDNNAVLPKRRLTRPRQQPSCVHN